MSSAAVPVTAAVPAADRVVVGVDGSPSSVEALQWAARYAEATHLHIEAVTSWQYPTNFGMTPGPVDWNPSSDAAHMLDNTLKTAFGDAIPAGLRTTVTQGHPAQVLIGASENAQALVVGSRGHGGFVGLLLGSVSVACAEHAYCPVVIAHSARTA